VSEPPRGPGRARCAVLGARCSVLGARTGSGSRAGGKAGRPPRASSRQHPCTSRGPPRLQPPAFLALSTPGAAPRPPRGPSTSPLRPPPWSERRPSHGPLRGLSVRRVPAPRSDRHLPSSAPLRSPSSRRAAAPCEGRAPAAGGPPPKLLGSGNTISSLLFPQPEG
jgi:hypothetical protein